MSALCVGFRSLVVCSLVFSAGLATTALADGGKSSSSRGYDRGQSDRGSERGGSRGGGSRYDGGSRHDSRSSWGDRCEPVRYIPPRHCEPVRYCPPPVRYCPPPVRYCPPPIAYCPPPRFSIRIGFSDPCWEPAPICYTPRPICVTPVYTRPIYTTTVVQERIYVPAPTERIVVVERPAPVVIQAPARTDTGIEINRDNGGRSTIPSGSTIPGSDIPADVVAPAPQVPQGQARPSPVMRPDAFAAAVNQPRTRGTLAATTVNMAPAATTTVAAAAINRLPDPPAPTR